MESLKYKGVRDLVPPDMEKFRFIERTFSDSCKKWGYEEVRTPTLEYLYLFTSAGTLTPAKLNKVYSFLDWDGWSGERVVLRPDGTIPVARLFIENMSNKKTAKLFYVTNVFSFETTKKQNREKWQCGIEYLGGNKNISDVEIVILTNEVLNKLGLTDIRMQLSHAGMMKALFKQMKLDAQEEEILMYQLKDGNWDKLNKFRKDDFFVDNILSLLLNTKGAKSGFLENIRSLPGISTEMVSAIDDFIAVTKVLDKQCVQYQIDITTEGDFEYYTGMYFKIFYKDRIVGAGGRYDGLIPLLGGSEITSSGSAIYVDQIMKFIPPIEDKIIGGVSISLSDYSPNSIKYGVDLIKNLHRHGRVAEFCSEERKNIFKWKIDINSKIPHFVLTDRSSKLKLRTSSLKEVIQVIKEGR